MIPRSSVLVVYCSGGDCDESEAVARMLTGSGYKSTYVMHDGIPGWTNLLTFVIVSGSGSNRQWR